MRNIKAIITLLTYSAISQAHSEKSYKSKQVNVGFFLSENDTLTELAIKSSLNIINYYTSTEYFLHPLIYRIKEHNLSTVGSMMCEMVEKGVAAIFGPDQPAANEIIQSLSLSLEIPQFQTFWNPNLEAFSTLAQSDRQMKANEVFSFNLYPNPYTFSKALATLVRENDWKSYTIIYENDDGLVRLQELLKAQNPNDPPVSCKKLGPGPDYRTTLKEVRTRGALHIILDCQVDHIIDILFQAKEVKLLEDYHAYVLTSLDAHTVNFSQLGEVKANISMLSFVNQSAVSSIVSNWEMAVYHHQRIQIPSEAVKINTALLYDALNLFITSFSELDGAEELEIKPLSCELHENSTHGYRLAAFIAVRNMSKGKLLGPLTGPIVFDSFGQRSSFKLQIVELHRQILRVTGIWSSEQPNLIHPTISLEVREKERVEQLRGKNFRVVSRIGPPYLTYRIAADKEVLKGNNRFEGYAMDLIDEICKILNCTYTFLIDPDNQYGSYDSLKKEWNGLIRQLLDRNADLAVCDLTTTSERRKAVDFTSPFMTLGVSILYAKVVKPPPELLAFTNPLSLDVWLYMGTAFIIVTMIIFLVARLNPSEWENPHPCNPNPEELENIWTVRNCFWLTLGSLMAQGCDILPKGISTRVVTGMWWFFSLIMTASYTANLAAFLTMERMGPTIQSAEDLAGQAKIKYGCVSRGATASFFKETNVSTYHRMWVQMEAADPSVFEESNDEGVKRVINSKGKYAFLMESSTIEYEMVKHCELMQVGSWLDTKGYGIAMPTDAPYRTDLNQAILKMQEMGQLQQLKQKWWHDKNNGTECKNDESSDKSTAAELGLPHVGGVFVVLAGGIAIAFIFAIFEFLWNVRKVAIVHHVTLKEAYQKELKFAMDIWVRKKAVEPSPDNNKNLETEKVEEKVEFNGK